MKPFTTTVGGGFDGGEAGLRQVQIYLYTVDTDNTAGWMHFVV